MSMLKMLMAAGGAAADKIYVDDVFSTWLYTGNGSTQTINNGIDLAGKGGLVWGKSRSNGTTSHVLVDTVRGLNALFSNLTSAQVASSSYISAFNSNGFSLGNSGALNNSGDGFTSWTFRKAPKFFDVVTYTGNGVAGRQIPHSLGVAPGMIVVKQTDSTWFWRVYHRNLSSANYELRLHTTDAETASANAWNNTHPTSSEFTVGTFNNANGATYVAYLFAHDTSADGIIQCGSFTTDGSGNATVTLGWEPQFVLVKASSAADRNWEIVDTMRGYSNSSSDELLFPNLSNASMSANLGAPTATGFSYVSGASITHIYLAIRRPNKPPTSGTQVYNAIARTGTGAAATVTGVGFAPDTIFAQRRRAVTDSNYIYDKLRGTNFIFTNGTNAETVYSTAVTAYLNDGFSVGTDSSANGSGSTIIQHCLRRAPGVFDVVCLTSTGSTNRQLSHQLAVVPEFAIMKGRSVTYGWGIYHKDLGKDKYLYLNSSAASVTEVNVWTPTAPTASTINVNESTFGLGTNATAILYLFATLPGISKVGSYTGNGSTQTINCGFTTGARFFLVKATSTTGSWWVFDTARGIVAATDFGLQLNSTAAETTSADAVDPDASGVIVNQEATCSINANGVNYVFLAFS